MIQTSNVSTDRSEKKASGTIYFYVYPSAFQNPGGGEVLLLKTKEYLEKLGVPIRLFDFWNDRFEKKDLLHVFGSVKEGLGLMEVAKSKGVKLVHSPIIWYNWQSSFQIPYQLKERYLCVLRQIAKVTLPMLPSARKKMMSLADVVLAGSQMEADQIARYFLIPRRKIEVVTYGADEDFLTAKPNDFEQKYGLKDFVLTVGRIEPRKNQLNLIRALKGSQLTLVIIGDPVSHHQDYYNRCREEAGGNVHFLGSFSPASAELLSATAACKVFVLATWFETPGLAALEAALAGARIVITSQGSTKEYFKDFVDYVNPASVCDIRKKIDQAFKRPRGRELQDCIYAHYLWKHTATQTLAVYRKVWN